MSFCDENLILVVCAAVVAAAPHDSIGLEWHLDVVPSRVCRRFYGETIVLNVLV